MIEALQFEFMQNALIAGLLASVICGVMGTMVVVNRIVFLSGGIAHAAFGGIGLAFFFGWPYLVGTIGFSVIAALVMAIVTLKAKHRADTIIGVIWAIGMAIGILLLDLTPGYNVDLMSYLFGSILTVPDSDIWMMVAVAAVIFGVVTYFYNDYLALSYDEEFAQIRGVRVNTLYVLMIVMLALGVVMIIQVVGLILVIALMTIPPYIAEKYSKSLVSMMVLSSVLSALFTVIGLWLSYVFNLTSGASIIIVAGVGFLISLGVEQLMASGLVKSVQE
ncbi:MAG: metal ABC transporter permease [Deltaproteobacteria bacterium]|jgi:zinc transport system permease protein|nr:metal ABC transporter permease [Deltaproteobacteria bacterium]MBW2582417.1 metal ABC transporter permease [Deltaproteobacteria bacterium]